MRKRKISIGLTEEQFEQGVHICQIFNDDDERKESLISYIISGLASNEKTACFTEKENESSLSEFFAKHGLNYKELEKSGDFTLSKVGEVYFQDGVFDPERMLKLLKDFYKTSGKNGARVIGEMMPEIETIEGGSRLMEYESKVSLLQKEYPVTAVCQYDARKFDGSTILDILKVHPLMIVRGKVVNNPFFIPPEEYLSTNKIEY